ncbi:mhck ef2 kinase domain isoform B [Micractinium conductrix]|nr:mhck ef2 kinase domain isoform B [Micractinium conductrix]|eukprot:PSC68815.1 mhck ef2 kinase domain isoform B [Micractinium conductrix]
MSNCIEQIKAKALDIFKVAPKQYPDATTRLAFVGYRDFYREAADAHFIVSDFVEANNFSKLESTLAVVHARGGSDAEDVTGALKKVLDLSWASTTRLLIHFGDAPCHGNRYHDGGCINGSFDSYPGGNPDGLVPEDLLRQLVACRVDYHFARINSQTDIMCEIFKKPPAA